MRQDLSHKMRHSIAFLAQLSSGERIVIANATCAYFDDRLLLAGLHWLWHSRAAAQFPCFRFQQRDAEDTSPCREQ
jgi:hypothetical protein